MAADGLSLSSQWRLPVHWRAPLAAFAVALALLLAMFHETYWSLVTTWGRSGTFAHGFLIVPIVLFLIWRQRQALAGLAARPYLPAAVLLAGLSIAWLLGALVDVISVRQFSVVLMVPALVWLLLGSRVAWQLFFPLAYLLFAVPFGTFLVDPLMIYTADFTVGMVRLSGVPVYREGMFFSLPSGHWSVVEACSGIRYLIASVALGALYAHITYRTWLRRLVFMLAAVIVPIVANGLRAYMIVMIGHLSDMSLAVGVDHLLYGWVFFGLVIFLMFWVGSFWRQTPAAPAAVAPGSVAGTSVRRVMAGLAVAAAVIVVTPLYAAWMDRTVDGPTPDLGAPPAGFGEWQLAESGLSWKPAYHHARDEWHATYRHEDVSVGLYVGYYAEQFRHGEMIAWENTLAGRDDDEWRRLRGGQGYAGANEEQLTGPDGELVAWQWYWVNGRLTSSPHMVKVLEAVSRLMGNSDDAAHVVIFSRYEVRPSEVVPAMEDFAEASLPVVRERLEKVQAR